MAASSDPLKVIIAGAPASGKGTQCELIVQKYGLAHISAGDMLRAEVAKGSEYGKKVSSYMESGQLVPDDVVITIVKSCLESGDAKEKGWLLDGYPRSASQAEALVKAGISPDVFILLEVPDEILVERVVGRRMDPETGRIYHLKFGPPETDEIRSRLIQRSDDTEEKVKLRLETHNTNMGNVTSVYSNVLVPVDGNRGKDKVFADVEQILDGLLEDKRSKRPQDDAVEAPKAAQAAASVS